MNLKDAFRAQNKLQSLLDDAMSILEDQRNIVKTETIHLRKKVMPDVENESEFALAPSEYADQIGQVANFMMYLLEERVKLSDAIQTAKAALPIHMDSEVSLNHQRQSMAALFRRMAALRSAEKLLPGGGIGYRFNAEGNQVQYRCDAREVTTINFDRNQIRALAARLDCKSDEISAAIDRCLINSEVFYSLPFDLNAGFDEVFQDFIFIDAHF
ncbi:MAG: hypothetical protein HFE97_12895 [Oscillospiraceae bacterium]|nr:hypothetical protein [Oscillospiraceae bacterium]